MNGLTLQMVPYSCKAGPERGLERMGRGPESCGDLWDI